MTDVLSVLWTIISFILGIIWIIAGVLVAVVAWLVWKLVKSMPKRATAVTEPAQELFGQAKQVVGTANEGARTAKEAIAFVSEKAVMPTIMVMFSASERPRCTCCPSRERPASNPSKRRSEIRAHPEPAIRQTGPASR